ncbi:MAG: MBL fold metallo-hydrolase [Verrucomicrobiota bacterium]
MLLKQIYDPYLSQYAYLIGCPKTGEALIIDAQRDVDRYLELAAANDLRITAAAETHIHADFLGGIRQLARKDGGVRAYLSKEGGEDWQYEWAQGLDDVQLLEHGDVFEVGSVSVRAIHTPGHTPEHLSFLIADGAHDSTAYGLVSGDFMFVGDVGRPDLLEEAAGEAGNRMTSARTLYGSIEKFDELDDHIALLPGHGEGSSCGKSLGSIPFSTVGYEKRTNPAVRQFLQDEKEAFLDEVLSGQPAPPPYFARMKNANREGVELYDTLPCPPKLKAQELSNILLDPSRNATCIDVRADMESFMQRHLTGSIYAPFGQEFSEAVGSYAPYDDPVHLLLNDPGQLQNCVRQLIRIGIDRIEGYILADDILGQPECEPLFQQIKVISMTDLDPAAGTVVDVRSTEEYEGGHVPGALNLPHTRIVADADRLPGRETPLTVHCSSGDRASLACAALARMGYAVTFAKGSLSDWKKQAGRVA